MTFSLNCICFELAVPLQDSLQQQLRETEHVCKLENVVLYRKVWFEKV